METPWIQLFPEYAFLHLIGKGAYGHVWLVQTPKGGHLALKWIPNTPGEDPARIYFRPSSAVFF